MNPDYVKAVATVYNEMLDEIARDTLPDLTRQELVRSLTGGGSRATGDAVLARLSPATRQALLRDALRRFIEGEIADLEDRGIVGYRPQ